MDLTIKDQTYQVEFRYITKYGKGAQLHRGPVKAVTTCVLIAGAPRFGARPLIAIDSTLCAGSDNFSRPEGRRRAFHKLLDHCGALRGVKADLWVEFHRKFSGVENCPRCAGQGWLMKEDGEMCPDCLNEQMLGGTGFKGGILLYTPLRSASTIPEIKGIDGGYGPDVELIDPPPPPQRKHARVPISAEAIVAFKEAGIDKRLARRGAA